MRSIIRVQHDKSHSFLTVSKDTVRDGTLSFELRGFLMYLLAKPDDWRIRPEQLAEETGLHKATVYRLLQKLMDAKYIRRVILKRRKGNGTIYQSVSMYTVYESREDEKLDEVAF